MATYHIKTGSDGRISAGTLRKDGTWNHRSDVTQEALIAVREHLLRLCIEQGKDICCAWEYPNGKMLVLKLEEKDKSELEKQGE